MRACTRRPIHRVIPCIACWGFALGALFAGGGCYHHVISATGPGSEGVTTYEPNLKTPADQLNHEPSQIPNTTIPSKKYKG